MTPIEIRRRFSPILPPRGVCAAALGQFRAAGKKPACCACTVECEPDGELRVQIVFADGQTRSLESCARPRLAEASEALSTYPQISAWISRWKRWRC